MARWGGRTAGRIAAVATAACFGGKASAKAAGVAARAHSGLLAGSTSGRGGLQQALRSLGTEVSAERCEPLSMTVPASKHWMADANAGKFMCRAPEHVQSELRDYIKAIASTLSHSTLDSHRVARNNLPQTEAFLRDIEDSFLINGPAAAVLEPMPDLNSVLEIRLAALTMSQLMGDCLEQNAKGERSILVFDRDASRKMVDGQRYHQSHEGGSLHTDNVNIPQCWEFMLLTCLQPAVEGGESILVSAASIYQHFRATDPEVLESLAQDFWWEYRGFNDAFYRAPILFANKMGEPCFRWLREYMESAHQRLNLPFDAKQQRALDALTAATLDPRFQWRHRFRKGEILFANDLQLFHGRTAFKDAAPASEEYDFAHPVNRLMQRNWVQTASPHFRGINQSRFSVPE